MKPIDFHINVPFVRRKSIYLAEVTYEYNELLGRDYLEALLKEIESAALDFKDYTVHSITFHGYPDILGGSLYKKILQTIRRNYQLEDHVEINFPVSVDCVSQASFTEIIGQKINHPIIKYGTGIEKQHNLLKRPFIYTAFSAMEFLLKNYPLPNTDIEIYYGINGSTIKDLERNLQGALSVNPSRVYFQKALVSEDVGLLSEEEIEKQFEFLSVYLGEHGYHLQNAYYFTKGDEEFALLNDCLGFGLGEETYLEGVSYRNTFNLKDYLENSDKLEMIASKPVLLDEKTERKRKFLFELLFNNRILDIEEPLYKELTEKGYLNDDHLSSKGIINLDKIINSQERNNQ